MGVIFFIFFMLSVKTFALGSLGPNEVSILYPLPQESELNMLISHQTANNILPKKVFELIPFFMNVENSEIYPLLKVIGIRIDPCFQEGTAPVACQKQVRLIWQPIRVVNHQVETLDATLHVFFKVSDKAFANLIQSLKDLNAKFPLTPERKKIKSQLTVNPKLQQWGLNSDYARALRKIILTAIYKKELSRITFMKLKGDDDFWIFGGFDFQEGKAIPIKIPHTEVTEQEFINEFAKRDNPQEFQGGIFPEPSQGVDFNLLVRDSMLSPSLTEEEILTMIKGSADIDHPLKHNPGTVDCVSCHVSNMVKEWLFKNSENKNLNQIYSEQSFKSSQFDLTNVSKDFHVTNNLRMFGYFKAQPMISQRTINETALVLEVLSGSASAPTKIAF